MAEKTLVLRFKSEVAEAKGGIAELRKGITGIFDGVPGSLTSTFAGAGAALSGIQGVLNNILPALGTLTDTARAAIELASFAADRLELQERVSRDTVEQLRASSAGLISTTNLLSLANRSSHGDFALTSEQMNTVTKAARVLSDQYQMDINEVLPALVESLQRGKAGGFGPFGIAIEDTTSKAQVFSKGMAALTTIAGNAGDVVEDVGDKIQRLKIDMANTGDEAKSFFGEAAIGFGLLMGEADEYLKSFGGTIPASMRDAKQETISWGDALMAFATGPAPAWRDAMKDGVDQINAFKNTLAGDTRAEILQFNRYLVDMVASVNKINKSFDTFEKSRERAIETSERENDKAADEAERQEKAARAAAMAWADFGVEIRELADIPTTFFDSLRAFNDDEETIAGLAGGMDALTASIVDGPLAALTAVEGKLASIAAEEIPAWKKDLNAIRVAGDQFFDTMGERGVAALDNFGDAAGNAYGMILRGQVGVAEGAMMAVEQILIAEAIHAFSLAVKSALVGLYDLAIHDYAGASAAFTASAGLFAYAAAAGLVGSAVGSATGGGGGGGEISTGAGGGRDNNEGRGLGGVGSGQGPTTIEMNFNLGYGFVGDEKALGRVLVPMLEQAVASGAVRELRGASRRVREHG